MPLPIAPQDTELTVKKILAEEKTKKHFEDIGIFVGTKLTLLSSSGGSVIVRVRESKLALDRSLAMKILV